MDTAAGTPTIQFMSEMASISYGHLHDGPTLAEIEQWLRADGRSQAQIDLSLAVILIVREELARRGRWPPAKPHYLA